MVVILGFVSFFVALFKKEMGGRNGERRRERVMGRKKKEGVQVRRR
jgi:hypothetical protein